MKKSVQHPRTHSRRFRREMREILAREEQKTAPYRALLKAASDKMAQQTATIRNQLGEPRRQFMSEERRRAEEAEKEERRYWAQMADPLRAGDADTFIKHLVMEGPRLLAEPEVQTALHEWWDKALDDDSAQALLSKICPPLAARDNGRPIKLTEQQAAQNKRQSALRAKHTARASHYCDKAVQDFLSRKQRLAPKHQRDAGLLRTIAEDVASQHFLRGGEAKQEAQRLYREEMKKYLPPRRVRKNPDPFC